MATAVRHPLADEPRDDQAELPDERRHKALLRMLGHVKAALRIDQRTLYRAAALAGYNANPNTRISNADPGQKARWAEEDAEALLAVGSDTTETES